MDMRELVERKYQTRLRNIELEQKLTDLSDKLARMKVEKRKQILEAVDENGKRKYTNQEARDVALKIELYSDIDYQELLHRLREIADEIEKNKAFIDYVSDLIDVMKWLGGKDE